MQTPVKFRARRTVTHVYESDYVELSPSDWAALARHGAPESADALPGWLLRERDALLETRTLPEKLRRELSRLDFFNENRGARSDHLEFVRVK